MGHLQIDGLTKVFSEDSDAIVAVDDLNLDIEDGEFLVLVGPSGCGKSTTLRCIAGLEEVTEGEIILDDEQVTKKQPKNRNMAMVFQNYALYPHMTARQNMSFGLKMSTGLTRDEIRRRVEGTAEMMGISELLDERPGELSGGQQQRVALGRVIVREPAVFLMDEPLSNLDAKLRATMRTELQELQQSLDVTTIYVTHDQTEAMTMGDRIVILKDAELQQIGTPLECYHEPINQFVASFIGSPSMNMLETTLSGQTLVHDKFEYRLSEETAQKLSGADKERFILGVRPEDIQLADADDRNTITIEMNVTEPVGDTTYAYFNLGSGTCTASLSGDQGVEDEDRLHVTFPEERMHLFDADTGKAIKNSEYFSNEVEPEQNANV